MTSLSVFVALFQEQTFMLLGCRHEFGIEAGTLFLIQFFGSFHIFGLLDGFV
jgi:hypothetical protein